MLRSWAGSFSWPFSSFLQKFSKNRPVVGNEKTNGQPSPEHSVEICLQSIFTWQNKTHSYLAIGLTYIGLWFVYWALQKPYYVLSLLTTIWLLYDLWFNYVWPEIRVPTHAARSRSFFPLVRITLGKDLSSQLSNRVNNLVQFVKWLSKVRADNHGLFSAIASLVFVCVAVLGYFVPGLILAHIFFAIVWGTSCGLNLPWIFSGIDKKFVDFEELVPSPSRDDLQVLERAREARPLPGIANEPSFLDLPSIPAIEEVDVSRIVEPENELQFIPMHFDHRDLSPTDRSDDFLPSLHENETPVFGQQILNLAQGVINSGRQALGLFAEPSSDSATDDFEILSHSDFEQ